MTTPQDSHYYLHVLNEENEFQELSDLPKITQLARGRGNIWSQIYVSQSPSFFPTKKCMSSIFVIAYIHIEINLYTDYEYKYF